MSLLTPGSTDERVAILKLWDQQQNTLDICRLLGRDEPYIEAQLHQALDLRRAVKGSLRVRVASRKA